MIHPTATALVLVLAAGTLAGCAETDEMQKHVVGGSTKQITEVTPSRGFLPQPGLLTQGGEGQPALVYRSPDIGAVTYTRVLLAPVIIRAAASSDLAAAPADQRQALAEKFYSDLYSALSQHCTMVTSPSPGTLRLRFALVDADTPDAAVNTVATYAPYVSTAHSVAAFAFNKGVSYFAGTATAEAYATDAATGKLLWQAVDKRGGTTAFIKDTSDNWADINHAFEAWSAQLEAKLQSLGMCPA